ncbi:MAG: PAS domain S-box protein, partial [Natronomonas sp.]
RLAEIERQQRLCESLVRALNGQSTLDSMAQKLHEHLLEYAPIASVNLTRLDYTEGERWSVRDIIDFDDSETTGDSWDISTDTVIEVVRTGNPQILSKSTVEDSPTPPSSTNSRLAIVPIVFDGGCRAVLSIRFDKRVPSERRFIERIEHLTTAWFRNVSLRSDLRQFRNAVENAGHAVVITDIDGTITYVNPEFEALSGYTPEEALGQSPAMLNSGVHDDEFYQELWRTILSGDVWQGEIINERKDGSRYTIDQTISPIVDGSGHIDGFVAINRDVTAREERERNLRQFRSAVEHAGHAVVITNVDGIIEYVNPAFESLSGYSAAEAIGETPALLKSGEHDREFYQELWGTVLAGDIWRSEVVNESKDGSNYVVDQTIAPIQPNPDEPPTGFVSINQDITDLKEYEHELEQQNERLSEYGRMVAHDLRNPLMLLNGRIEGLERLFDVDPGTNIGELAYDLETSLEGIAETTEYMHRLIDDLLSLAEKGQLVLDPVETSLESVATKAWKEIDSTDANLSVEEGTLEADPERFRELLSNLFRNAVEHGDEEVSIRVGPLDFVDGFFVEDDGPGIPDSEREKVLERGYTTEDTGTGFGLALVDRIAEGHRWDIVISESSFGGARFEFRATDGR